MKLAYTSRALRQIDKALGYVALRSPAGVAKIAARLAAILTLARVQPLIGLRTRVAGVRRVFLTPYPYLIYQIGDDEIVVLRFRHTSQDPATNPGRA